MIALRKTYSFPNLNKKIIQGKIILHIATPMVDYFIKLEFLGILVYIDEHFCEEQLMFYIFFAFFFSFMLCASESVKRLSMFFALMILLLILK